jgi:murein DD-endopeptidase MepM/ murein hydrolase activator NlpD
MKKFRNILLGSAVLSIVSACVQPPISDIVIHQGPTFASPYKPMDSKKNPYRVIVKPGDTLYSIAKEYSVPLRPLIQRNRLYPPYKLYIGQDLKIPKAQFHIVKDGDSLYSISRGYDVDLHQLAEANDLTEPYYLNAGKKLKLPFNYEYANTPLEEEETISLADEETETMPATEVEMADGNAQELKPVEISRTQSTASSARAIKSRNLHAVETKKATSIASKKTTAQTKKGSYTRKATYSKGPVRFSWPSKGRVISSFGPKKGGLYNDGINISAPDGAPIKAAEEGKVVYAGNELRGYGNLILIKHKNGYLTAYAHARRILVKKGSFVRKGDVIAEVGKTGNENQPQLHFSIRKGRKALNPKKYL